MEKSWIENMFAAIDRKDTDAFMDFLAPSCIFRFGNMPLLEGKENIRNFTRDFFASLEAISHDLTEIWNIPNGIVCHGRVKYTRKDASTLVIPFADILKRKDKGITQYLIFADASVL